MSQRGLGELMSLYRRERRLSGRIRPSVPENVCVVIERNTTSTGVMSGSGDFRAAFHSGLTVICFVVGSFCASLLLQSKLLPPCVVMLVLSLFSYRTAPFAAGAVATHGHDGSVHFAPQ